MAAKQPTATAKQATAAQFVEIPLSKIKPSPTNPRKFFNPEQLAELTESVRAKGILEPILVRSSKGHYEIIAGERRWRAAKEAKLDTVPAIVREMNDDEVLDAQIHENLHRADVHPMDEAFGYQHLLKVVEGLTVEELARRVGKSARYIAQRLSLVSLIEPAVKDFMEGLISLGHATQIARLAPEVQQRALDHCYEQEFVKYDAAAGRQIYRPDKERPATVSDLNAWISQNLTLDLKKAPWGLEDAELVPAQGPCSSCQFNTAANLLLFGDAAKNPICTNREGYERKMLAWIDKQTAKLKGEGAAKVLALTELSYLDANARKRWNLHGDALANDSYQIVEKKTGRCEFSLPGVFVQGHRRGQVAWVCTNKTCKDHMGRKSSSSSSAGGQKTSAGPDPAEVKKKRERRQELLDARVAEPVRRRVLVALLDKINPDEVADRPGELPWPLPLDYFRRFAWEHFTRVPSDTQRVVYETLGWKEVLHGKSLYNHEREKLARPVFDALSERDLVRFMFLISVAHYGENLNVYGPREQASVVEVAAQHGVPYDLFFARELYRQSPGKKYYGAHGKYLFDVLMGRGVKSPNVFTNEKLWNLSTLDAHSEVEQKITPVPMLDGPEGVVLINAPVRFWRGELVGTVGTLINAHSATTEEAKARDADQPWHAGASVTCVVDVGGVLVEAGGHELVYVAGVEAELEKRRKGEVQVPTIAELREAATTRGAPKNEHVERLENIERTTNEAQAKAGKGGASAKPSKRGKAQAAGASKARSSKKASKRRAATAK